MNIILKTLNDQFDGTDETALKLAYDIAYQFSGCRLCGVGKGVGAIAVRDGHILACGLFFTSHGFDCRQTYLASRFHDLQLC